MKRFNYKSRKGFTLIELLVVIGILAVLAAIAIPSVAGLIDRANVSADDTNANEMTNAIERFTSEYELFCQDIASGKFNKDDMDATQSRVYNVTGIENRDNIEDLESTGHNGKQINRDTKYPTNIATTQSIIENYTKTSSATFEPKQSDMHFWYSPDCGVVVYGEPEATKTVLNEKIISGKDAKGKTLDDSTTWIDMTNAILVHEEIYVNHSEGVVVEGATYTTGGEVINAGANFPTEVKSGDTYLYGDYKYTYRANVDETFERPGWTVSIIDKTKSEYGLILGNIAGKPVTSIYNLYAGCTNLTSFEDGWIIPDSVADVRAAFKDCTSLVRFPNTFKLPNDLILMASTFSGCTNLEGFSSTLVIPKHACRFLSTFKNCTNLSCTIVFTCTDTNCECMYTGATRDMFTGTTKTIIVKCAMPEFYDKVFNLYASPVGDNIIRG